MTKKEALIYFEAKIKGEKFNDYERGPGYYIHEYFFSKSPIGQKWEVQSKSGKTLLFELIHYKKYKDPADMIEYSHWNLIGFKGQKLICDCTFDEFCKIYCNYFGIFQ